MNLSKRLFDLALVFLLSVSLLPAVIIITFIILIVDGRPIFYISERMKTSTQGFRLVKFRTMRPSATNSGVSGNDKSDRITRSGRVLRKTRLDELPQLWNILKGDISFVGPRPPLRIYVERFPDIYRRVLQSRPGLTGLASVYYHAHEEALLRNSRDADETDAIYSRACIPRKARLDLIYQDHRNLCMDFSIMLKTVFKRLR